MRKNLPVLLSIPHGGEKIPSQLKGRLILSRKEIFEDIDAFTREIYDLGEKVAQVISSDIARTFVDLNRAPDDLPPQNPDGVIKSHTCYGKIIYQKGLEPDNTLIQKLLKNYYYPYHQRIEKILSNKNLPMKLALDCHSMAAVAPPISPDIGKKRPLVCLGNVYGNSCSQKMINEMANCFRYAFSIEADKVSINKPFAGGYITRKYGKLPLPWIQVELNRSLYLQAPSSGRRNFAKDQNHIEDLRQKFEDALQLFFRI